MARTAPASGASRGTPQDRPTGRTSSSRASSSARQAAPGLDQVGPLGAACGPGPGPGASGRCGRGRPSAGPRARPSPGSRPAGCSAGTRAGPSAERLLAGRRLVAHHARHQPGDRLDHDEGGRLPAGQHEVADRQLAVDQVRAHPLVDPLVAPAQQARTPAPAASSAARAWSKRRPPGSSRKQRAGAARPPPPRRTPARATAPSRRPPPNGRVVDRAVAVGGVVAQVVDPHVDHAPLARPAEQALAAKRVDEAGEDREDVDPERHAAPTYRRWPSRHGRRPCRR